MEKSESDEIIRIREEWFRKHYSKFENEVRRNITKGKMSEYLHDLIQVAVLQFLRKPLEVQYQMLIDNKVQEYLLVTCKMHIISSTSPFYNEVRKHRMSSRSGAMPDMNNEDENELLESQEWYQCFKRELPKMNFYYRQLLLDKYQDGLTFDELHKKYNINKNSLTKDIKAALQFLRCRCDNDCR